MSLEKIMSISGKPGLYELKSQTRGGFLAESLLDGKKSPISARNNVSMLNEISIYTHSDEVPLREVFENISKKEAGKETISHKEPDDKLKSHFKEILPEYDEDRVYLSDIKKVFQWYNLLVKKGMTDFSEPEETEGDDKPSETAAKKPQTQTPSNQKTTTAKPSAKKGNPGKGTTPRKTG
jgi:hypothetical protein